MPTGFLLYFHFHAALGSDRQHMACPLTQRTVDACTECFQQIKGYKGLHRTGETAAMDAICAAAL